MTASMISQVDRDTNNPDNFGNAIDSSGDIVVAGSVGALEQEGAAYVFKKDIASGHFVQPHMLVAPDGQVGDHFGYDVAVDGDTIVVGAPGRDAGVGKVYIYSASTGYLLGNTTSPNGVAGDNFGWSVDVDGDIIVVGSPGTDSNGVEYEENAGAVYVYRMDGQNTFNLLHALTTPTFEEYYSFTCLLKMRESKLSTK